VDEHGAPHLITATAPADYTAGLAAAMGVCAALFHRDRTGEGQYIASSLLSAGLALQAVTVSRLPAVDAVVRDPMMERVNDVRRAGGSYHDVIDAKGDLLRPLGSAFRLYYGGYDVKDGAIILGALTDANRDQMRRAMGIDDDPTADPDFNGLDPANDAVTGAIAERIREIMKTRTMTEWEAAFAVEGAPVSRVNLAEEMADDPQVQALGIMVELEHELTGPETMVGSIVQMSETPTGSGRPSPPLDRHTDEVLAEHGVTESEIAELRAANTIGNAAIAD
jgi:crotonobetainyl-CoA:carnitine CoA-transferase CaiB-like acyl-CoA transferase